MHLSSLINFTFNDKIVILKININNTMVFFMCGYCDSTLKKKQCENHARGRCSPANLICIDCSQIFNGDEYKKHLTCIS